MRLVDAPPVISLEEKLVVALPESRTHPKGRHRPPPLDAPGVSSGIGTSQVPPAVLIEACRKKPGPKGPDEALIRVIVELKSRNPRFGCPRIAHYLADVRDRHRQERRVPRAVETLSPCSGRNRAFMVVVHRPDHKQPLERRPFSMRVDRAPKLLGARGHGPVHASPCRRRRAFGAVTGADVCCMFNAAIHGQGAPRHLSTDHDPLFEAHRWAANLRILEIDEIKTVPYVPLSHLLTIRRSCCRRPRTREGAG